MQACNSLFISCILTGRNIREIFGLSIQMAEGANIIAEREARQLIVLHGDSVYICMYVYIHVSNATGMQHISCGARHCFHACAVEPRACTIMESPCRKAAVIRKAMCTATQKSGSEERKRHRWEIYRQRVRLIRQQESDEHRSQSLRLAEWSAEQRVTRKCNSIPARLSAWNTMYAQ